MRAPADDGLALDAAQYINALLLNAPSADMRALWAWRAAIDRDLSTAVMLLLCEVVAPLIPDVGAPAPAAVLQ